MRVPVQRLWQRPMSAASARGTSARSVWRRSASWWTVHARPSNDRVSAPGGADPCITAELRLAGRGRHAGLARGSACARARAARQRLVEARGKIRLLAAGTHDLEAPDSDHRATALPADRRGYPWVLRRGQPAGSTSTSSSGPTRLWACATPPVPTCPNWPRFRPTRRSSRARTRGSPPRVELVEDHPRSGIRHSPRDATSRASSPGAAAGALRRSHLPLVGFHFQPRPGHARVPGRDAPTRSTTRPRSPPPSHCSPAPA
jgi:hypothetical protein